MSLPVRILLKDFRARKGITKAEMCRLLGISQSTYTAWEQGEHAPSDRHAIKVAAVCGVSLETIIKAVEDERREKNAAPIEDPLMKVPILGSVAAGSPVEQEVNAWTENLQDYAGTVPRGSFAVRVKGDSMQCPSEISIPHGSLCVCSPCDGWPLDALVGRVVCVKLEGDEHLIKQLIKSGNSYVLKSFNAAYDPIVVATPEAVVEGVAFLVINRLQGLV